MERDKFYYVINVSDGTKDSFSYRPTRKHLVHAEALAEAHRLAKANPGKEFVVFRPMDGFVSMPPEPTVINFA